ncbi:MAG: cupin domain-containing protein [Candidatus Dormibacteria bacterium]
MSEIRLVRANDLVEADPTPGVRRQAAIASDRMWAGLAHTQPGMISGWHHHGDHETSIYVFSGALRMEFGPGGASVMDARPGDFIHVPAGAIHREGNPTDTVATMVVVRAGRGVPTVNVDGPDPR